MPVIRRPGDSVPWTRMPVVPPARAPVTARGTPAAESPGTWSLPGPTGPPTARRTGPGGRSSTVTVTVTAGRTAVPVTVSRRRAKAALIISLHFDYYEFKANVTVLQPPGRAPAPQWQ